MTDTTSDPVKGPWPAPTDELRQYLREHQAAGQRPEAADGINQDMPAEGLRFEIVGRYDIPRSKRRKPPEVQCALGHRHYDGRYIWFEDGWVRPIGHTCAGKKYQDDYKAEDRRWRSYEQARERRDRFERIPPLLPEALGEIRTARKIIISCKRTLLQLVDDLPDAYTALANAAANDGLLLVERQLTDNEREAIKAQAEAQAEASAAGRGRTVDAARIERQMLEQARTERLGTLGPTARLFDNAKRGDLLKIEQDFVSVMNSVRTEGARSISDDDVKRHVKALSRAAKQALELADDTVALTSLLTPPRVDTVVGFLNRTPTAQHDVRDFKAEPTGFYGRNRIGTAIGVYLPDGYTPVSLPAVERLQEELTK